MWFFTIEEASDWCKRNGFEAQASGEPSQYFRHADKYSITVPLAHIRFAQHTWLSGFIASSLEPYDECLMWVTLSGVWPSSENWHLFYRLRESYGERRLLCDAPGHLVLKHETADLATMIGLGLLYGWDFHLLPNTSYMTGFVSHDEFLHLYTDNKVAAATLKEVLDRAKIGGTVLIPEAVDDPAEHA